MGYRRAFGSLLTQNSPKTSNDSEIFAAGFKRLVDAVSALGICPLTLFRIPSRLAGFFDRQNFHLNSFDPLPTLIGDCTVNATAVNRSDARIWIRPSLARVPDQARGHGD
jgi:hypothetical protein